MKIPSIHDRIRFFFRLSGLTQGEFARRAGISQPAASAYLTGLFAPRRSREPAIARALGVSMKRFMGPLVEDSPEAHP